MGFLQIIFFLKNIICKSRFHACKLFDSIIFKIILIPLYGDEILLKLTNLEKINKREDIKILEEKNCRLDDSLEYCPHCGSNLQGDPIPKEQQINYCTTHYSRKIGISSLEKDMVIRWQCPDCKQEWERE